MKMIKSIMLLFIIVISFINFNSELCNAETIIYDNITTYNYKTIKIYDNSNIKYINEYSYSFYIDDNYYGTYKKDDIVQYPDNSNISIVIEHENIELNNNLIVRLKDNVIIFLSIVIGLSLIIFVVMFFFKNRK